MLELAPGARVKLDGLFAQLASVHDRENGNGRAVRNLLECAKRCQAMRLMELGGRKTKEQLVLLTEEDFEFDGENASAQFGGGGGEGGEGGEGGGEEYFEEAPPPPAS